MKDPIWICRDGRRLHVKEMETVHIQRCIAKIDRGWKKRAHWRPRLQLELEIRALGIRY